MLNSLNSYTIWGLCKLFLNKVQYIWPACCWSKVLHFQRIFLGGEYIGGYFILFCMLSTKQLAQKFFFIIFYYHTKHLFSGNNMQFRFLFASFASVLAALMWSSFISSAQGWDPGSSNQGRGAPPEPMGTEALNTRYLQRPTLWAGTRTLAEFFKRQRVRREVWRNKTDFHSVLNCIGPLTVYSWTAYQQRHTKQVRGRRLFFFFF